MRIATGIIWIIGGAYLMLYWGFILISHLHLPSYAAWLLVLVIPGAFAVTSGVFCLKRKYWKLCFASALLAVLIMIYLIYTLTGGFSAPLDRLSVPRLWPFIPTGILPIIFVCIRRREWQETVA
jgi:hypothetical protein